MRYLLIDHITEYKRGECMKAVKNVAMSEDFLEFHFPKNPIMPGVMLLEALTQLAGWYEAVSSDFRNWFLISNVKQSRFYGFALPGDRVELEISVEENPDSEGRVFHALGTVNGKKKIMAEFEGDIVPLEEIEDVEEQKKFFKVLIRELKI
jgi:3-hydroxyacyl-[acyl-carrier-protein] dehydratase